ncbi:site-specific DNA-methyltransferase [Mycoplasmatota bacterium]|nr:site-specific DNA-methyltransferase [Mycoplasmatota bacterium]
MLGKYCYNKIYNEDSYKAIKQLPDNCIDLIVIDPPYKLNVNTCENGLKSSNPVTRGMSQTQHELKKKNLHVGIDDELLTEMVRVMKKINIYIWCNKRQLKQYFDFFEKYECNFELLVWCKTNPTPATNNTFLPDIEYCFYFREKGVKLRGSYDTKHKFYIRKTNQEEKALYLHPTIKPLQFIKNFIINSSDVGNVVADFFIGSGTTAVASKELHRNYIGFEIDPEYYKIAVDRINGITAGGQTSIFTDFEQEEVIL